MWPSSSCSRTQAMRSATTRMRSPPRRTSAQRDGGSPSAVTRGCSTTGCTRAVTHARGSFSRRVMRKARRSMRTPTIRPSASSCSHAVRSRRVIPTCPRRRSTKSSQSSGRWCSSRCPTSRCARATTRSRSTSGATQNAACRPEARARRWSTTQPRRCNSTSATSCSWRKCSERRPDRSPTPIQGTGTRSG